MKFLEMFKNKTAIRYLIFGVILFAATIGFSFIDSADDVKVTFETDSVLVTSDRYKMTIQYDEVEKVTLEPIADAGESVAGKDTMVLRTGTWKNDTWGEHYICADLDCTQCIVVQITDGRTLVFSSKNDQTTAELYETLLTYLPNE